MICGAKAISHGGAVKERFRSRQVHHNNGVYGTTAATRGDWKHNGSCLKPKIQQRRALFDTPATSAPPAAGCEYGLVHVVRTSIRDSISPLSLRFATAHNSKRTSSSFLQAADHHPPASGRAPCSPYCRSINSLSLPDPGNGTSWTLQTPSLTFVAHYYIRTRHWILLAHDKALQLHYYHHHFVRNSTYLSLRTKDCAPDQSHCLPAYFHSLNGMR